MMITIRPKNHGRTTARGFSLLEMLIVITIVAIFGSIALPQLIASRRLQRLSALPRQVLTQLRLARQQAMSQRRAITFQYDNQSKQITLIGHEARGVAVLTDPNYPNTNGSAVVAIVPLAGPTIDPTEISYGIPPGVPVVTLDDGTSMSVLSPDTVNITFQPDGSVINAAGQPADFALFFYSAQMPRDTASAVSVLGSAGRVKIWRYNRGTNQYVE